MTTIICIDGTTLTTDVGTALALVRGGWWRFATV